MRSSLRLLTSSSLVLTSIALPFVSRAFARPASLAAHSWQSLAPLPFPAEGLTALQLPDRSVLALGGDPVLGERARLVARLTLPAGTWKRLPDAPVELDTPAALALSAQAVLVVAPSYATSTTALPSAALELDPRTGRWSRLPSCPVPLFAPRLVRLDTRTVLAAGGLGSEVGATLDLVSHRWSVVRSPVAHLATYVTAPLPGGRALLVASVALSAKNAPYSAQRAFALDRSGAWRELARPPQGTDGAHAAALDDHRVLVAGAYPLKDAQNLPTPAALVYDASSDHWSLAGSTGNDHRGALLLPLSGGRALLVGGHGADGQPSAGCLLFDGTRWVAAPSLPGAWSGYAVVSLTGGALLLIGGDRPTARGYVVSADTVVLAQDTPVG